MNRASALADALRENGYACEVDHDVVTLAAPEHTEARVFVGVDVDGYLCSFAATQDHERMCDAPGQTRVFSARRWTKWASNVRALVAEVWPALESLEIPAAKIVEPVAREPVYEHAYPLHAPVEGALA